MSDSNTPFVTDAEIDALGPPDSHAATKARNDNLDSRARLCFRALSLCLAGLILLLLAMCLYSVTSASCSRR